MKFKLECNEEYFKNKGLFNLLSQIDFSEMNNPPRIIYDEFENSFSVDVNKEELRLMQIIISEEIVAKGMEEQNTVNEVGKQLYWIYDEILIQIKE